MKKQEKERNWKTRQLVLNRIDFILFESVLIVLANNYIH